MQNKDINIVITLLTGMLMALGAWSLSRTFVLSTDLVVSQEKVSKLEKEVDKLSVQMDSVKDKEKEIMNQHMDLFKALQSKQVPNEYKY
jgi:uncharacterized protein (DUF3084 family)|tara:strand:+ start:447 stop:713 length:267 start_codon:yes stop_codon:yes gene_type:complete